jgi:large subunit ribosomal protein L17
MRHRKSFNHLSRKKGHRKAMLANMASSLIIHKRIKTTTAKAKALRMFVEPLITKSKNDSTHARRVVFSHLQNKEAVSELFREVSPKIIDRPGGYTRILKTGFRFGDNADMCVIELVDYNENLLAAKSEAAGKVGRRRRRGLKKKAAEDDKIEKETAEVISDEVKESVEEKQDDKEEKKEEQEVKDETGEVKDKVPEEKTEKQVAADEKHEKKEKETEVKDEKEEETEVKDEEEKETEVKDEKEKETEIKDEEEEEEKKE